MNNAGFESGFIDWNALTGRETISNDAFAGTKALLLSTNDSGIDRNFSVIAGETYTLSGYAKTTETDWNGIGLSFFDEDWALLEKQSTRITGESWTQYRVDAIAPTGAVNGVLWAWKEGDSGITVLDNLGVSRSTPLPQVGERLSNHSFEFGITDWVAFSRTEAITTDDAIDGNQALKLVANSSGTSQSTPVFPGERYQLSLFAKTNSAGWSGFGLDFLDRNGNKVASDVEQITTTNWFNYQVDYMAPREAVRANVWAWKGGNDGMTVVDGISLQRVPDQIQGTSGRIEAEAAILGGSARVATNHTGFSRDGFVANFTQPGASTTFIVNAAEAGLYNTTLRYANGPNGSSNNGTKTLSLYVNGVDVTQTQLPSTTQWSSWNNKTEALNLQKGENIISYRLDSNDTGWVNLDYLWLSREANNGPIGTPIADNGRAIELEKVVQLPNDSTNSPPRMIGMTTQEERRFVFEERDGHIYELIDAGNGTTTPSLFMDVGAAVLANTGRNLNTTNIFHGGLRGVAFHPDFATNGKFYTSMMADRPSNPSQFTYLSDVTNPIEADSVVAEWTYDLQSNQVNPNSYREVIRIGMPVYDHPIKEIVFNPLAKTGDEDYGLLYITHGDGSVLSATAGGGLNSDALGKILRINPLQTSNQAYSVPQNNPFIGDATMLDEVYSLGHRNPHTISFAEDNQGQSHILVGEAGRDNIEEVNLIVPGGNYGWSEREGTFVHRPDGGGIIEGLEPLPDDDASLGYVYPAAQWGHTGDIGEGFVGQAIAGGYVGAEGSDLAGQYIFGDFVLSGQLYHSGLDALVNAVTTLDSNDPSRDEPGELTQASISKVSILFDHDNDSTTPALVRNTMKDVLDDEASYDGSGRADIRFGQGPNGELYLLNKRNGYVYRINSSVSG